MLSVRSFRFLIAAVGCAMMPACAVNRDGADPDLVSYIDTLKAIDVHAHPPRFVADGAPPDSEFDALPLDGLPPFAVPVALRPDNHMYRDAQNALFNTSKTDSGDAYKTALESARRTMMQRQGEKYATWALDQAGIDVMLSNRIVMGAGLAAPRFRWVPFADPLMLPLDVSSEAARTPDTRPLYPLEAKLLRRYLSDLGIARVPSTLDAYERDVIVATLRSQRSAGAVGIKFEASYLRSLEFATPDAAAARSIYARYAGGGVPSHADYTTLEDYLFRVIAREAGKLGLTIQIHATELAGGYYDIRGSSVLLLESAFNDSTLRGTNFVITHGGWPRVQETLTLFNKPNVYADISMMSLVATPTLLTNTLRLWLSEWPEKVMFGSDAFDGGAAQGWEQIAWIASHNSRKALATALTGMVRDGEISPDRAREIATMVMRTNAIGAYHLSK